MGARERVVSLSALREGEAARMDAACIRCGACFAACPMVPFSAAKDADPVGAVVGVLDLLVGGAGDEASRAWTAACTRTGSCNAACPAGVDPRLMLRLAKWRASETGALPKRDARDAMARAKVFARLGMSEDEQARWL